MEITIPLIKWFIAEREDIRLGKTTTDEVLLNSRFCNIHREDDKVSRWIFENCRNITQVALARLINRIDLLEDLQSRQWSIDSFASRHGPVTNAGAYQFYPRKGEKMRDILLEVANADRLTTQIYLTENMTIKQGALFMSAYFDRSLHFYWMMVLLDLGHMKLLDIDMYSEPYAGPGGHKVLKALNVSLMELAELLDVPAYTAEHVACEVRKYVDRTNDGIPNNRKYKQVQLELDI